MTTLYIEIDPGSGYQFAGEATTKSDIGVAEAFSIEPRWRGYASDKLTQRNPAPAQSTLEATEGVELCGVLDENALLGMEIASLIDVHGLAKAAKNRGWGQERIRALV